MPFRLHSAQPASRVLKTMFWDSAKTIKSEPIWLTLLSTATVFHRLAKATLHIKLPVWVQQGMLSRPPHWTGQIEPDEKKIESVRGTPLQLWRRMSKYFRAWWGTIGTLSPSLRPLPHPYRPRTQSKAHLDWGVRVSLWSSKGDPTA